MTDAVQQRGANMRARGLSRALCIVTMLGIVTMLAVLGSSAIAQQSSTLVVAAPQTPTGFDGDIAKVATRQMVTQSYDGLVSLKRVTDANGKTTLDPAQVSPLLAESWTISPDGKTYTFKLRERVLSAFGNELTADDLVWSWDRAWDIKRTTRFLYGLVVGVESWKKLSRYEVSFALKAPNQIFLPMLSLYLPMIIDSTEVKKHATPDDPWALKYIDQNLVGFGPYTMQSFKPGEQVVLAANKNYFRGAPYFERVIYREVPSAANRVALLKTGQVQWVEDLPLRQIVELKKDPAVKVESVTGTQPATVRLNAHFKPYDDARVRGALAHATKYDEINRSVFQGLGVRVRSIVPPTVPGSIVANHVDHDVAKAKALLAEAGYPDGIDLTLTYAGIYWWMEPVAIQLKNQWAEAGIRLTLERLPDPEFVQRSLIAKRDIPMALNGDATFVLDAMYTVWIFGHSSGTANRSHFDNPEFDKMVIAALSEQDQGKRLDMAHKLQQMHADANDWVMLDYPGVHGVMGKCIQGWTWYPDDWPRFYDLKCVR
jgi:ABC-type transport system substrate-binding protein